MAASIKAIGTIALQQIQISGHLPGKWSCNAATPRTKTDDAARQDVTFPHHVRGNLVMGYAHVMLISRKRGHYGSFYERGACRSGNKLSFRTSVRFGAE